MARTGQPPRPTRVGRRSPAARPHRGSVRDQAVENHKVSLYNSHMRYVPRALEGPVVKAARSFPATVLTGPRRAGKTWLLRHVFPNASYFLLEDPDVVARLRADPQGFLDAVKTPVILD